VLHNVRGIIRNAQREEKYGWGEYRVYPKNFRKKYNPTPTKMSIIKSDWLAGFDWDSTSNRKIKIANPDSKFRKRPILVATAKIPAKKNANPNRGAKSPCRNIYSSENFTTMRIIKISDAISFLLSLL